MRRVLARVGTGIADPPAATTAAENRLALRYLPDEPASAARWAVASMELAALICTARAPSCDRCPVTDLCAWHGAGRPAAVDVERRRQTYEGTDRQCRGALLTVLRSSDVPVDRAELDAAWPDPAQRDPVHCDPAQLDRALASLLADGLVVGDDELGYAPTALTP